MKNDNMAAKEMVKCMETKYNLYSLDFGGIVWLKFLITYTRDNPKLVPKEFCFLCLWFLDTKTSALWT